MILSSGTVTPWSLFGSPHGPAHLSRIGFVPPSMTSMSRDDLIDEMERALRQRRAELVASGSETAESRRPVELDQTRVGRLSRMDALQGQAMAEAQEQRRQLEIRRIDAALARIEDDTYGDCVRCGAEIDEKRLRLDPAAPLCIECARGT